MSRTNVPLITTAEKFFESRKKIVEKLESQDSRKNRQSEDVPFLVFLKINFPGRWRY